MIGQTLRLKVAALTDIAPSLRHVRLVAADGGKLPPAAAGAHIQLVLAGPGRSFRNAYSLVSRPGARDAWDIIVRRVPASRGGSAYIREALQAGDTLEASWPGNLFAPVRTARRHLMIAGGIGITPFLSYLADFAMSGGEHALHVCCREEEKDVFAPWLAGRSGVAFHWDADGHRLDIPALLAAQPAGTHLYVCGPAGFIDHVVTTAKALGWAQDHIHLEYFGAPAHDTSGDQGFEVRIASTGKVYPIAPDVSVVEALRKEGIDILTSCEQGVCGTCLTRVLEGEVDHRDMYLTDEEKAANEQFMPCCSRARSKLLVLDL